MQHGPDSQGLPTLRQEDVWFPQNKAQECMDADGETLKGSDVKRSKASPLALSSTLAAGEENQ